MHIMVYFVP